MRVFHLVLLPVLCLYPLVHGDYSIERIIIRHKRREKRGDVLNSGKVDNQEIYNLDRPRFKPYESQGGGQLFNAMGGLADMSAAPIILDLKDDIGISTKVKENVKSRSVGNSDLKIQPNQTADKDDTKINGTEEGMRDKRGNVVNAGKVKTQGIYNLDRPVIRMRPKENPFIRQRIEIDVEDQMDVNDKMGEIKNRSADQNLDLESRSFQLNDNTGTPTHTILPLLSKTEEAKSNNKGFELASRNLPFFSTIAQKQSDTTKDNAKKTNDNNKGIELASRNLPFLSTLTRKQSDTIKDEAMKRNDNNKIKLTQNEMNLEAESKKLFHGILMLNGNKSVQAYFFQITSKVDEENPQELQKELMKNTQPSGISNFSPEILEGKVEVINPSLNQNLENFHFEIPIQVKESDNLKQEEIKIEKNETENKNDSENDNEKMINHNKTFNTNQSAETEVLTNKDIPVSFQSQELLNLINRSQDLINLINRSQELINLINRSQEINKMPAITEKGQNTGMYINPYSYNTQMLLPEYNVAVPGSMNYFNRPGNGWVPLPNNNQYSNNNNFLVPPLSEHYNYYHQGMNRLTGNVETERFPASNNNQNYYNTKTALPTLLENNNLYHQGINRGPEKIQTDQFLPNNNQDNLNMPISSIPINNIYQNQGMYKMTEKLDNSRIPFAHSNQDNYKSNLQIQPTYNNKNNSEVIVETIPINETSLQQGIDNDTKIEGNDKTPFLPTIKDKYNSKVSNSKIPKEEGNSDISIEYRSQDTKMPVEESQNNDQKYMKNNIKELITDFDLSRNQIFANGTENNYLNTINESDVNKNIVGEDEKLNLKNINDVTPKKDSIHYTDKPEDIKHKPQKQHEDESNVDDMVLVSGTKNITDQENNQTNRYDIEARKGEESINIPETRQNKTINEENTEVHNGQKQTQGVHRDEIEGNILETNATHRNDTTHHEETTEEKEQMSQQSNTDKDSIVKEQVKDYDTDDLDESQENNQTNSSDIELEKGDESNILNTRQNKTLNEENTEENKGQLQPKDVHIDENKENIHETNETHSNDTNLNVETTEEKQPIIQQRHTDEGSIVEELVQNYNTDDNDDRQENNQTNSSDIESEKGQNKTLSEENTEGNRGLQQKQDVHRDENKENINETNVTHKNDSTLNVETEHTTFQQQNTDEKSIVKKQVQDFGIDNSKRQENNQTNNSEIETQRNKETISNIQKNETFNEENIESNKNNSLESNQTTQNINLNDVKEIIHEINNESDINGTIRPEETTQERQQTNQDQKFDDLNINKNINSEQKSEIRSVQSESEYEDIAANVEDKFKDITTEKKNDTMDKNSEDHKSNTSESGLGETENERIRKDDEEIVERKVKEGNEKKINDSEQSGNITSPLDLKISVNKNELESRPGMTNDNPMKSLDEMKVNPEDDISKLVESTGRVNKSYRAIPENYAQKMGVLLD